MVFRWLIVLGFVSVVLLSQSALARDVLVLGVVADSEDSELVEHARLKAEQVTSQLKDHGFVGSEVYVAESVGDMVKAFNDGRVDWVTGSLFPALLYAQKANADIFVQRLLKGVKKFHSVFFVHAKNEINSLDKLERKKMAFGSYTSTSAYFIPFYELFENNYTMVGYGQSEDKKLIGKKRIYYSHMNSENEIVKSILDFKADIGVLSNTSFDRIRPEFRDQLKVIHRTPSFPVFIEAINRKLDSSKRLPLKNQIKVYNSDLPWSVDEESKNENRFYDMIGEGRDGYVYFKNIIKHETVPIVLENQISK